MKQILLYIILIPFLFSSCSIFLKKQGLNYSETETLPGVIKILDNFYYDQYEARNIDWREYMYWNERIFGIDSEEYKSTCPDSTAWCKAFPNINIYSNTYYLRHGAYNNHPVVGISQEQAFNYSSWRSDRVFEMLLVKNGIIEMLPSDQNSESYFTIESYFNGNYKNIVPDTNFSMYPVYTLPTFKEWKVAISYTDSIQRHLYNKSKFSDEMSFSNYLNINSNIIPEQIDTLKTYPTRIVFMDCKFKEAEVLNNLRGNAGEWTSVDNICVGGGWINTKEEILKDSIFSIDSANAWTGFRNVCRWKKWEF